MLSTNDLKENLELRNFKRLRQMFRDAEAADIGERFGELTAEQCVIAFRLVPKTRRSDVFSYIDLERQEALLEELPEVIVTSVVNDMEPDDRTKLLEDLPFEIRSKLLLRLSPDERRKAWQLLSYEEDTVGRLMTPDFFAISADMKAVDAISEIRWNATNYPEQLLSYVLVRDQDGKFVGELSLAKLITADPPTVTIRELMTGAYVALKVADDQSTAVDVFRKYDRQFSAVVDEEGVLRGVVTADDVFDVAEEAATEVIQQFGGSATLEDGYFQTPLRTLFRKRAGWLAILFFGGTITAGALRHYEHAAQQLTWLIFFLPLIVSSGGNTGSQAASLIIRGIALKEMEGIDWAKVLRRELLVCVGLGLVLGFLGFARALFWNLPMGAGFAIAASLLMVVVFGGICGSMLPFLFQRFNLDPAISSSPLLAQLVDLMGALIFYNIALLITEFWDKNFDSLFGVLPFG